MILLALAVTLSGCALVLDTDLAARLDLDGDGVPRPDDCDDGDASVGAAETIYADADGDGVGSDANAPACGTPTGFVKSGGDCDDTRADVSPIAEEVCDGRDNNCDGLVDENGGDQIPSWYLDNDGDGYGVTETSVLSCAKPLGYAPFDGDCNDVDATVNPGVREVCDGRDEDCSGEVDDPYWWTDVDGDGYGTATDPLIACEAPAGRVAQSGDCDDADARVNPSETEICDDADIDEDCDGLADDADPSVAGAKSAYYDHDRDGHGDSERSIAPACDLADRYSWLADDCDDTRADVSPDAEEVCYDGLDQNCDAIDDNDCDRDGSLRGDDCDDANPYVSPLVDEACGDDVDNDCDGEQAGSCHLFGEVPLDDADGRIAGHTADDKAGDRVTGVGDVDGDGFDDVAVSAVAWDIYRGRVVTIHGPVSGEYDWDHDGSALEGCAQDDEAGYSISPAGDIDGDGLSEWIMGAPNVIFSDEGYYHGAAYIIGVETTTLCEAPDLVYGGDQDFLGYSVAANADFTGDGTPDVAVAQPGHVEYNGKGDVVVFGAVSVVAGPVAGNVDVASATLKIVDTNEGGAYLYGRLQFLGDIDGDGIDELGIGDNGASIEAEIDGAAYIFAGGESGTRDVADATATVHGRAAGEQVEFGFAAGDADGDGRADFGVVSAKTPGEVSIFVSPVAGRTSTSAADIKLVPTMVPYGFGADAALAGDVNGDGRDDLLIMASSDNRWGCFGGSALLYFGPLTGAHDETDADATLYDENCNTMNGQVAGAGDTDADGFADVLVSDSYDSEFVTNGGVTWLFRGGP